MARPYAAGDLSRAQRSRGPADFRIPSGRHAHRIGCGGLGVRGREPRYAGVPAPAAAAPSDSAADGPGRWVDAPSRVGNPATAPSGWDRPSGRNASRATATGDARGGQIGGSGRTIRRRDNRRGSRPGNARSPVPWSGSSAGPACRRACWSAACTAGSRRRSPRPVLLGDASDHPHPPPVVQAAGRPVRRRRCRASRDREAFGSMDGRAGDGLAMSLSARRSTRTRRVGRGGPVSGTVAAEHAPVPPTDVLSCA